MGRLRLGYMIGIVGALAAPAAARAPAAPIQLLLRIESAHSLVWEITASGDARIVASHWKTAPASVWSEPPFEALNLAAGETVQGRVSLVVDAAWIEARLVVRDGGGEWTVGASVRAPAARPDLPLPVTPVSKATTGSTGWVSGTFHYEDRWLDAGGYRGDVQRLPLRFVDADLITTDERIVARGALDAFGAVRLGPVPDGIGPVRIRLASAIRRHPTWRMDVVEPRVSQSGPDVQAHRLETEPVVVDGTEVDLGTVVVRDPDGFGRVQAFHILDNAVDVWEALADPAWFGSAPGAGDSLRIFWGPTLRVRGSAYGSGLIEIASPASGDTDGWSDAVILHEIGHFVVDTFLRDDTPGGAHLLGDVHQDPRLAYSEGLASAFTCWVRARRMLLRRNVDAAPMDRDVTLFVNAGMPPPDGQPGGLQYAWDVEAHTLGGAPLVREGIESETNVAGVLLDLVDASSNEGADDDRAREPLRAVFDACRALRDLPRGVGVTFEDFYRSWIETQSDAEFSILRRDARIEYELDLAEPDVAPRQPPSLWSSMASEPAGGIVIAEIWTAPAVAVELVNRGDQPVAVGGWQLLARSNDSSQNPSLTYTIPSGVVLGSGARLLVVQSGRRSDDRATQLHAPGWTVPWFPGFDGALGLRDAAGRGVDFVRWDARNVVAPSRVAPIPGTSWNGNLLAALPGNSLARRGDRVDRDHADEFADAKPTPGGPNDAPGVHRTFFPAADVDRMRWWIPEDGTYTIQARRMRNGALPEIEVAMPDAPAHVVRVVADHSRADARITLALRAGDTIEARFRHVGSLTQLGSYDVAAWRETDARIALPPAGVRIEVAPGMGLRQVTCSWWNAAQYDSIVVRVAALETCLAGDAREMRLSVPEGRHEVEIAGWSRGIRATAPRLTVAVEDWPAQFSDGFDAWPAPEWESSGWETIPVAGRGQVLTDSPTGDYADDRTTMVRLRTAFVPSEDTVLRFSHVCAVRPEDGAWVEASTDWGATWSSLGRYDWNDRPRETGNWRDGRLEDGDWSEESLPLGAFAGRPTQIRFRLASDIYAHADGWYLDALSIEGTAAAPRFALRLAPNVPNPFNPTTRIHFDISQSAHVVLRILDVRGRWVRTLLDAPIPAGAHAVEWDGRDAHGRSVASGVYVSELRGSDARAARTLVLVR